MEDELIRHQAHITYAAAREALEAGLRKAEEVGVRVALCITDAHGDVLAVARMDGVPGRAWEGARGKASFAAAIGKPTADFIEQRLRQDEVLWRAMSSDPDVFIVPGGFPMLHDGVPVGGVGASGAKHEQDAVVAEAAARHFEEAGR